MDFTSTSECPTILQLQKWEPSGLQLNLSDYREAFISPTRKLLLLLTYECEALLLPLGKGEAINGKVPERNYYKNVQNPSSLACSSPELAESIRSDLGENISSTSESIKMVSDKDFSLENNFSRSNSYPFVCDVNSLAWGICGDTYNQYEEASFRELLFVSGNHGVTVHAFRQPNETTEVTVSGQQGDTGEGTWVEWGPSVSLPDMVDALDPPDEVLGLKRSNGTREPAHEFQVETGEDEFLKDPAPRSWLRTFLTKPETLKSEGKIWTRFPESPSFPSSATVVSFSVLGSGSPVFKFLSDASSPSRQSSDALVEADDSISFSTGSMSSLYKCFKVFSSNSHRLIGFVLRLVDFVSGNGSDLCERNMSNFVVVVAKLFSWGIQWVCSVKLDASLDGVQEVEWTDFGFSDNFLFCLSGSGLLFFCSALTGECIARLDLLQIHGFRPHFSSQEQGRMFPEGDLASTSVDIKNNEDDFVNKRTFRRLLIVSQKLLVAVLDESGVVYIICVADYVSEKYFTIDKSSQHLQQLGLQTLVGSEVGGAKIFHPRVFSKLPASHDSDIFSVQDKSSYMDAMTSGKLSEVMGNKEPWEKDDSCVSGFTTASHIIRPELRSSELPSRPSRKIFLPSVRHSEDDVICFSFLGITRFHRKHDRIREKSCQIFHSDLHIDTALDVDSCHNRQDWEALVGEAVGCAFQGCLYLVTEGGLSVVLPSVSVSPNFLPIEAIGYRQIVTGTDTVVQAGNLAEMKRSKGTWAPWKLEILDRVLLYEGPEEADDLCSENGWDLKLSRMRRLQLALHYLKFDEIQISLEMLSVVNLAEEGVMRLIFAAAYLMFHKVGNDNEVSGASRLLSLATSFATKLLRKYGLLQHKKDEFISGYGEMLNEIGNLKRLQEMAHFLEIIRNLQCQLSSKFKRPGQRVVDGMVPQSLFDNDLSQVDSELSVLPLDALSLESANQNELLVTEASLESNNPEKLALMPMDSLDSEKQMDLGNFDESLAIVLEGGELGRKVFPLENPKDMIARWEVDNLDHKNMVKDALLSGRLPLAVLRLHLHRLGGLVSDSEPRDTFAEVRDIGKAIAYDLFLKGETGLAVATLQKLGEDVETALRQLVFGTVRRSIRIQIADEMRRYGYLGQYELKILEMISLVERVYPCSSFWSTFCTRQKHFMRGSTANLPKEISFRLLHLPFKNLVIGCGDIDGVVLGSWTDANDHPAIPVVDDDSAHVGYWAAAAVWSDAWDQRTIDRIVLDQPFLMGVNILWESQLDYHICHNDWVEIYKILDVIPSYSLSDGSLHISLDGPHSASSSGCKKEFTDYGNYKYSIDELDFMSKVIPNIRILRFSINDMCCLWLRTLIEQQLARKFIFLKEFWDDTAEIVPLLAQSGFIMKTHNISSLEGLDKSFESSPDMDFSTIDRAIPVDAVEALHELVLHHCIKYNLPNLLDLYLDHHELAMDHDSMIALQGVAGDCQWAKFLLFSRVRGHEYDASFSNARLIVPQNVVPGNNLSILEVDDIVRTVDDIAEGAGEMAALATLTYAPIPIQDCLSSGSVNRHHSSSAQCTLENLRPALQEFPTLWRALVAACFEQDPTCTYSGSKSKVFGSSDLSDYLNWRDTIFFSSGRDTSLLQMLPYWFSKKVRRLIQLYIQGPLGWQSLAGLPSGESLLPAEIDYLVSNGEHGGISAMSWEAAIQKHVERELYASSIEENGLGFEHHLHRGRSLGPFYQLLAARVQKLKAENAHRGLSGTTAHGQTNVQADVHTLLAPLTQSEESLLASVIPLAILHFEDSVLVASCAFLLELCGLSASMLQIDIAALRQISSFYGSSGHNDHYRQLSPKGSTFATSFFEGNIVDSLARALADDYLHHGSSSIINLKERPNATASKQPSRALMLVLQHLERASLPALTDGMTCGHWLLNGNGDGAELRSRQKAASQHWNLVTIFCQMHQIPLSTKYLAVLARDNDWVGFLSEAQIGGYPFETVIEVASKEFSDPRLKNHILTVMKSMQSRKMVGSSSNSDAKERRDETSFFGGAAFSPVELFGIIAECEKQKNPGEALLLKAKDLCWSILALIASCFPEVSLLYCLTVWVEITAARETSSIKVNDIASQIAKNVGAAIEATNSLPASSRICTFHYNRRIPKRRRLMEPRFADLPTTTESDVSMASGNAKVFVAKGNIAEEEREKQTDGHVKVSTDSEVSDTLSKMVAVLCEQRLFLPLLRAFEMFLPSCSLLPFIRALQAFSQMRLSEASAHLGSFSARIKEEAFHLQTTIGRAQVGISWISSTAVKAADAMLSTCPSPYEKRCLLQLLAATDFGDGGSAATYYRRLYWKINLAEPSLRKDDSLHLGNEPLDDAELLAALEKNGLWEQARDWARQLEASGGPWKSVVHHVTETQAESMVAEWKEYLWDVPEERVALWGHCQTLFLRYSFPALQAGLFFLKHAESVEKDLPSWELHELLLLSLQWLSGMITQSNPVYSLHLLREIETRVWLLAVESEAQVKSEVDLTLASSSRELGSGKGSNIIDRTASVISRMDNHISSMRSKTAERSDARDNNFTHHRIHHVVDASFSSGFGGSSKAKRRAKGFGLSRRPLTDTTDRSTDIEDVSLPVNLRNDLHSPDENIKIESSFSKWEERVGPEELERAVLSLLEFGQIAAARQLQHKLSQYVPSEFILVDAALKLAAISTPGREISISMLDDEVRSVIQSYNLPIEQHLFEPLQVLESLTTIFTEGGGRGLCSRIISVVKAANMLGLSFSEAFDKQPIELLQLLSLKAQESFEEANLLVQTHSMPAASIAQILAESFLKGLLAAHRGGYMDSQKEEGPAPLLWRFSDFLKWAELCPSEPEIGHALMRLVITGQEIPHACEVELLILSHHFYKSSACLDGVDVLVALAATRVEAYVSEGDFACLARLITGVGNFHALNFILGILIENGQLDLLLQKYSAAADTNKSTAEAVRGFRMAVLTSLKQFNPNDLDAFAMVYNHFDMKHETASLLESRAEQSSNQWFFRYDKDQTEDLLESMRYYIEAAEVHSSVDAGNKTRAACAQASLVSLQIRMPDVQWLNLSETNARRALVEQSRFQEALIVAEAYGLNQPSEWALVLWNQMLKPELTEQFVAEFVAVLPLQPSMLMELARFYRAEVVARGDQSQFSVWLTGGGLPAEWAKYLGRSFRCLLKRTRDVRLQLQLASIATGFADVISACAKVLDRVPENAGPLVLRKGHGGAYLPLM